MKRIQKMVLSALVVVALGLTGCANSEPAEPIAADVWAQVESNFPDGITSSSPLFPVTEVEDVSEGTIRAHVQDNLTDERRAEVARHIFNMGGMNNDALKTVVVRDLSGKDSNHRR